MTRARQRLSAILCVLSKAITKHGTNLTGKLHSGLWRNRFISLFIFFSKLEG